MVYRIETRDEPGYGEWEPIIDGPFPTATAAWAHIVEMTKRPHETEADWRVTHQRENGRGEWEWVAVTPSITVLPLDIALAPSEVAIILSSLRRRVGNGTAPRGTQRLIARIEERRAS